jgi:hypothetical protein
MIVSFQDEFGGYSSRLRIDSTKKRTTCDKVAKEADMQDDEAGPNVDVNLCQLLNIDVDKIALRIAMGEDPWADEDDEEEKAEQEGGFSSHKKLKYGADNLDKGLTKTDNKQSTLSSLSRKSPRSQSDMKL